MSSAWLLPEHVADVLPAQARRTEELRRALLDIARSYGFELVAPPLLEHLESLLSGSGADLDLQTFKLVDQLSGRTLGVRADTTPQVARIDAHLLNRSGVTRLCYCGPVLHAMPVGLSATREPLQFGAEIYGHAGLEADLEAQELALDCLRRAGVGELTIELGDARIVRTFVDTVSADGRLLQQLLDALAVKDAGALNDAVRGVAEPARKALHALPHLYGDADVLDAAARELPQRPDIERALSDLRWLHSHLRATHPDVRVSFDLADLSGYAYYSGPRFTLYAAGAIDAIVRGGRYDEVGAVFGRSRPAVGFSLDVKALVELGRQRNLPAAIRAPWGEDAALRAAVRGLRERGETVVCVLPGHAHENEEFDVDRELVNETGRWSVRAL